MGSTLEPLSITGSRSGGDVTVDVVARGTIGTTFTKIFGLQTLSIQAQSSAQTSRDMNARPAEVMLVLDNTGSMNSNDRNGTRRMDGMKSAVLQFLDVVYGDNISQDSIAIGMLPYNTMVNVGHHLPSTMVKQVRHYNDNNSAYGWKGCVFADPTVPNVSGDLTTLATDSLDPKFNAIDAGAHDIGKILPTETAQGYPAGKLLVPFYYPPIQVDSFQERDNRFRIQPNDAEANELIQDHPILRQALIDWYHKDGTDKQDDDIVEGTGSSGSVRADWIDDYDKWNSPVFYDFRSSPSGNIGGRSPNYQCPTPAKLISYQHERGELESYVSDENEALNPGTGTFHNIAMTWAYRLLVRDTIFLRAQTVQSEQTPKRYIIFMTDGNFDSRDDGRTNMKNQKKIDTAYTAYGTYEERRVVNSLNKNDTIDALTRRFVKTCQAAKRDDVEIYTIAFDLSSSDRGDLTRAMFKECSTNPATHFFDAATSVDLEAAYRSIASDLTELHLSR